MVRLRRAVRVALATLATLLVIFGSPAIAQQPQRIVAVGDLHGDYQAWMTIARAAGMIDAHGHWAGGKTILVQTRATSSTAGRIRSRSSAAFSSCREKRRAPAARLSSCSATTRR